MLRHLRTRRGQIVIPTLFVFPSLILFIFLISETAKLSREKIRHQFALDSAAFIEMTNYSDFLNRTAYVNGAFPYRIFEEGFNDPNSPYKVDCDRKTPNPADCPGPEDMSNILFKNGVYPRDADSSGSLLSFDEAKPSWKIAYCEGTSCDQPGKNSPNPVMNAEKPVAPIEGTGLIQIFTSDDANKFFISFQEAKDIFALYTKIYQLLGSVEDAQNQVLVRLSSDHNFLKKSYWLNTGDPPGEAEEAAQSFAASAGGFKAKFHCHQKAMFYGNQPIDGPPFMQKMSPTDPIEMPYLDKCEDGPGLFQVATVDPRELDKMREGYHVVKHWRAPSNYFDVEFNTGIRDLGNGPPLVHALVACGQGKTPPALWPNPTPKFQVRLYP